MLLVWLSTGFQSLPLLPTSKFSPFLVLIPRWVVCVRSRVSLMNSPVRLGVSPTVATLTGFFSQRFETLFPRAGALGCTVCLTPQLFLPVDLHTSVRPPVRQPQPHPPWSSLGCPSPPLLTIWMNVSLTPWLSDFHRV